jgi:hypothetical protein
MADEKFEEFITGSNFKQCPKCKRWIEKNQGCDHMTCKCGCEFCYRCGKKGCNYNCKIPKKNISTKFNNYNNYNDDDEYDDEEEY